MCHHHVGNIGILGLDRNGKNHIKYHWEDLQTKHKYRSNCWPIFSEELMKAIKTIIKTFEKNKKVKMKIFNRI